MLSHIVGVSQKSYRVNRPFNRPFSYDLSQSSGYRTRILLERNVEAPTNDRGKISKTLGTPGMCYGRTNVQPGDSMESTLPWQRRLKMKRDY